MAKKLHIKEDFTPTGVMSIVDSNGKAIQITDSANSGQLPDKLNVIVEATHTGINRNKVLYSHDGLQSSTDSWTKNYGKPVLLNHDSWSDPLGRVKTADFKQSVIDPEKHTIQLNLEITNKSAIERFLDGRYSTFSIGGYTDSAVCSICGKDQMKDGWCGHSRGQKYADKECYWTLGQMDYDEISVVNCPADVNAQAISLSVVGEDGQEDSILTNENVGAPTGEQGDATQTGTKVTDSILDNIDGILAQKDSDNGEATPEQQENDGDKTPPVTEPETTTTDPVEGEATPEPDTTEGEQGDSVEVLKAKIVKLNDTVKTLESEILTKDGVIAAKDSELETLSAERDSLKAELVTSKENGEGLVQQNAALAKFAHGSLAERACDLQIALGEQKLEDKEKLLKDYSTVTSKKLNDMINELQKPEKILQRVRATNPAFANNDAADGDGFEKPGDQSKVVTVKDAVDRMQNFFVNRQI